MGPGDTVADRFVIEELAGTGGMGTVYRARDQHAGTRVALKVLGNDVAGKGERFAREAKLLAELRHPRIVRYIAHGETPAGEPYLAMEWLEGEDLSTRLGRHVLTISEAVRVARHAAEGLASAHARGLVHRDIKPSNLFLPDCDIDKLKILDFGVARLGRMSGLTRTGAQLGTPGYMAPEQARGARDVDPRADVFSLGCVLFHCITGERAFAGDHPIAVLAKVLFEEANRASELRDNVPPALDDLVHRMLSKDPAYRPRDGAAVILELEEVAKAIVDGDVTRTLPSARKIARVTESLTTGEQRLLSVVLAIDPAFKMDTGDVSPTQRVRANEPLRNVVKSFGGEVQPLADGSLIVTLTGARTATDQAALGARCALAIRELLPGAPIALATGRGELGSRLPVGEVIDRAASLLLAAAVASRHETDDSKLRPIRVDELTAGLLGARFDVAASNGEGLDLKGARDVAVAARTLLGKPVPCVGRERELTMFEAILDECIGEPVARAVVVTGAAGIGKSRLRDEFTRKAQGREGLELWVGRGDPMSAGSPFGMLGQAIRHAVGLLEGEPIQARRQKLRARLAGHFRGAELARVAEFLGEIAGTPFPEEESVQLRAARHDAALMGDQMRRAWEDWLAAECDAHPVVLVLEDLHWGDLPTVAFVDAALRNLHDRPFMVIAFARPSVHDLFPKLWDERGALPLPLAPLTKRASEKLIRSALGDDVKPATIASMVERAEGNPLYLEELVRSVADGRGDSLPETVRAMVQARLEGLEPEARRILRGASIFGQVFWRGGLQALLGGAESMVALDDWLEELKTREVIARRPDAGFAGDVKYAFRHPLLVDAAYAMLTDHDRVLGHRLAGAWLEKAGEVDAMVLAEHFERGDDQARAVGWYRRAAEQALEGNDLAAVLARTERGVTCGAEEQVLGALRLLQAEAHTWRGELSDAEKRGSEALRFLPRGLPLWWGAIATLSYAARRAGNADRVSALATEMLGALAWIEQIGPPQVRAATRVVRDLVYVGRFELADAVLAKIATTAQTIARADPALAGELHAARSARARANGDLGTCIERTEAAVEAFEQAGDRRQASLGRMNSGIQLIEIGAFARAEVVLRDTLAQVERIGLPTLAAITRGNLGLVLALSGARAEGQELVTKAVSELADQRDRRNESGTRVYLAQIHVLRGKLDEAEAEARTAVRTCTTAPNVLAVAHAQLARVLLAKGDHEAALEQATEAFGLMEDLGGIDKGEAELRLVYAEALRAHGDHSTSEVAIATARDRLLERAGKIHDAAWRMSFLENVPENARTLSLAREWLAPAREAASRQ
jgi:eukaryotic-like serine/threonine-protein kinase